MLEQEELFIRKAIGWILRRAALIAAQRGGSTRAKRSRT